MPGLGDRVEDGPAPQEVPAPLPANGLLAPELQDYYQLDQITPLCLRVQSLAESPEAPQDLGGPALEIDWQVVAPGQEEDLPAGHPQVEDDPHHPEAAHEGLLRLQRERGEHRDGQPGRHDRVGAELRQLLAGDELDCGLVPGAQEGGHQPDAYG